MTARREDLGTASGRKADEEERELLSSLLHSQTDSKAPMELNTWAGHLLGISGEQLWRKQQDATLGRKKGLTFSSRELLVY